MMPLPSSSLWALFFSYQVGLEDNVLQCETFLNKIVKKRCNSRSCNLRTTAIVANQRFIIPRANITSTGSNEGALYATNVLCQVWLNVSTSSTSGRTKWQQWWRKLHPHHKFIRCKTIAIIKERISRDSNISVTWRLT